MVFFFFSHVELVINQNIWVVILAISCQDVVDIIINVVKQNFIFVIFILNDQETSIFVFIKWIIITVIKIIVS